MPRYDYACSKCGRVQEIEHPITEERTPLCCEPECGAIPMVRKISLSSFQFKGAGWSSDGYSKK